MDTFNVLSVNISKEKGTIKTPVDEIELYAEGVRGDAHSGKWHRMVSLLGSESISKFEKDAKRKINYGEFAENISTEGILLFETKPLDKFICKEKNIELEVTQIGKKCHGDNCAIFREVGNCVMPKEGIFAKVIKGGTLKNGDVFEHHPRVFKIKIITLSNRASEGIYKDLSGPQLERNVTAFFDEHKRPIDFSYTLIPDNKELLKENLKNCLKENFDVVFTTGGTGIGPKDISPDVVKEMLEKEIPGLMEMIRVKYGMKKPNALLSRSVAGVINKTLIFTLPGSIKAVNEYCTEILPVIEHSIYMLNELDLH